MKTTSTTRILLFFLQAMFLLWGTPIEAEAMAAPAPRKQKVRAIKSVEPIEVQCPVGTAPVLPWQVWVTYSDGTREWRQTRWSNAALSTEQAQADAAQYPVGRQYSVAGFILGDNTTDQGYPIEAQVTVVKDYASVPSPRPVAEPLPLKDVRLMGDNRLTHNRQLDVNQLLSINPRQMLYNYRDTYGLSTDGYPEADGWDSPTTKLKGHGTGHYLSALAFAYATEQDAQVKARLLSIVRLMVDEMRTCQERTFVFDKKLGRYREARDYAPEAQLREMKGSWAAFNDYKKDYQNYGYGYMNAIPAAHPALIECYRAYNNEDWVWAPYYTIHKQLAGLIDIALCVDDKAISDKALLIAKDMGLWVWNRLHYRTFVQKEGNKQERQARPGNRYEMWNMYIAGEVGGMEESLARLAMMTADATERAHLLEAAQCFDAPAFFDPVTRNIDDVRTRHANQHLPMITGALRTYMAGGDQHYYHLASNFWNMQMGRYVYAMGGVGNGEMWRQPYSQVLSMNTNVMSDWHRQMHPNPDLNETCCAYNLAKLTKDLNMLNPDDARYMDYYERVLMNQIVGSLNPNQYGVCYQYAVGLNATKPFGNETPQSTCCGGTGAENHVKYQEAAYFVSDNTMWVALYMPTEARWQQKGVTIQQDCQWPAKDIKLTVKEGSARFALKLRIPYWATSQACRIKLNGKPIASNYPDEKLARLQPCSYFEITEREWHEGDVVELFLPYTPHLNFGPDKMEIAAVDQHFKPMWAGTVMYGPLVMATPDVKAWNEAEFDIHSTLSNISLDTNNSDTDGTGGPLYALTLYDYKPTSQRYDGPAPHTIRLTPDYYQTSHATHYLRLNVVGEQQKDDVRQLSLNLSAMDQALETAQQRQREQEAWQALAVKVPAHSPWAPNGYQRLLEQCRKSKAVRDEAAALASQLLKQPKMIRKKEVLAQVSQQNRDLSEAITALNVSINTMRPGNLAEPEDLSELLPLVTQAKEIPNKTTELREAINYADMVVQYVNDGSGTHDLIRKATERLRTALK